MNTTIWILQITLATILTASGSIILIFQDNLKSKLSWLQEYSPNMVVFICLSKITGAVGLVIPEYLGILPALSIVAALGIAIFMTMAFVYHLRKKEYKDIPATILFFLVAVVIIFHKI